MWFLAFFAHRHLDFRIPETESLAKLAGIEGPLQWKKPEGDHEHSPFWYLDLPSEEVAKKVVERSILLKGMFEVWGTGKTVDEVEASVRAYPEDRKAPYLSEDVSFKVVVDGFGKAFTMEEQLEKMERFSFIPWKGPVKMKNPDVRFWIIDSIGGFDPLGLPPLQDRIVFFGREIGCSERSALGKYDLKKRRYIGPTSMDAEISFLMANQGLAQPGTLVYDPFVGTGSCLVPAAHFGALTLGADIDIRVVKYGKKGQNVWSNFEQYRLNAPVGIVRADAHQTPWRSDLREIFHAIICDPPYGVRAGGRKSGGKKLLSGKAEPYILTEQQKDGHIPSTAPYTLAECLHDLLDLAARTLVLGGRLVFFVPCSVPDYDPKQLPTHSILELVANSEQLLTRKFGRRLLTYEKTGEYTEEMGWAAAETSREFRERHVELVEKSRNEEIRALLKEGKETANGGIREDGEVPVSGDGSKRELRTYRDKWC